MALEGLEVHRDRVVVVALLAGSADREHLNTAAGLQRGRLPQCPWPAPRPVNKTPRYLVTATLTPTTFPVHGDFWATVTVKNRGTARRTLQIDYAVTKSGSGFGTAFRSVQLRPGQVWKRTFGVHAGVGGSYSLTLRARDGLGASKATAHGHAN
jgi:hypothetical protein